MYMASTKGAKKKDIVKSHIQKEIIGLIGGSFLNQSQVFPLEYDGGYF